MDNLPAHKVHGVREAIQAPGASLFNLPPYSPDFNPIEMAFSKLKALLRTAAARTMPDLWQAIANALKRFSPESASPGMAANMDNVGAKYPAAFADADGDHLQGNKNYKLHIPKDVPAALFWSVTVYDLINGSGLDNGQPFPSINAMDKPEQNADGSTDIYFGPKSPGAGKNWLATIPDKGLRDLPPLWPQAGVLRPDLDG